MQAEYAKWNDFFTSWRDVDKNRWNEFFNNFRELLGNEPPKKEFILPPQKNFEAFFDCFREKYDEHMKSGQHVNIFELIKIKQDEVKNCKILAWLLDYHGDHGQKDLFLNAFLTGIKEKLPTNFNPNISQSYQTRPEVSYDDLGRVDIQIKGQDFFIIIEAKIYAQEGNNQLDRYSNIINSKSNALLFYLTVNGNSNRNDVIDIKWKDIANIFGNLLSDHKCEKCNHSSVAFTLVKQFCNHIKQF